MLVEPVKTGRGPRAAQRQVDATYSVEPAQPLLIFAANQRVLEQCQQRNWREVLGRGAGNREQQGANSPFRERLASAVVRLDSPTPEQGRDPSSEDPVGRDQRCRSSGPFERLAER